MFKYGQGCYFKGNGCKKIKYFVSEYAENGELFDYIAY